MCELLGLSGDLPATLNLSLDRLARHGGPPSSINDGWGVAWYEGADVRLIKDSGPADTSDWLRFIGQHALRSTIVMAHIRKATMGARAYRNSQPFVREMAGRMHSFAHNGWLPGIAAAPAFHSLRFNAVGETDSELAFCGLLGRLSKIWTTPDHIPSLDNRLDVVADFAAKLRDLGPANFLYSDGDVLFAHADRRKSPISSLVTAPGLVFQSHHCQGSSSSIIADGISVAGTGQRVTLVASVPLTSAPWEGLLEGEVIACQAGRIRDRRRR